MILSGHLDSWDLGTGALDDAAGIGNVIEAARLISRLKERPRRTIRIVLYANEEFGRSGETYAVAHAEEVPLHQAALESDLGTGRVYRLRTAFAPQDVVSPASSRRRWRYSASSTTPRRRPTVAPYCRFGPLEYR